MTTIKLRLDKFPQRWLWVIAIAALAFLTLSLWLPYGFNIAGNGDEWPMLAGLDLRLRLTGGTLRPFLNTSYAISYLLTPDSFLGMNIVLAVMTFGRGVAIYYLLRRLAPQHLDLALVGGGLSVIYMGDNAIYGLVTVSITTALVFFLIALLTLIDYWQRPRWYIMILMWVTLAFSIGIYEVSYPLILAAPLILLYWNARFNWRLIRIALLWYLVPSIYLVVTMLTRLRNSNVGAYQSSLFNRNITLPIILENFTDTYMRAFGRVWQSAASVMPQAISDSRIWLVLITALVMGIALFFHKSSSDSGFSLKKGITLIAIGLIGFGLGYSPFAITLLARSSFRTLFYALPFASIALATLIFMLTRLTRIPRGIIGLLCAALAINYLLQLEWLAAFLLLAIALGFLIQYEWRYAIVGAALVAFAGAATMGVHATPYPDITAYQQRLVTTFVKQAPAIKSESLILWTGTPNNARPYTIIRNRSDIFDAMMRFVYKRHDIDARMCNPKIAEDDLREHCNLEHDEVVISSASGVERWSYDRVIAFTYEPEKGAVLLDKIPLEWMSEPGAEAYNPQALIDHNAPLPYRIGTVWTNTDPRSEDPSTWQDFPPW